MSANAKLLKKAINKHKSGQFQAAEELYKKILHNDPRHVDSNYMLGTLYAESGRAGKGLDYMLAAEKLSPHSHYIKNNIGNIYRMLGDYPAALQRYYEALSLCPDMVEAYNNIAILYRRLNETAKAIDFYAKAISFSPGFTQAHFNMGKAYWDLEKYDDAAACFTRVLELQTEHVQAHNEMGNYYLKKNNKSKAIEHFRRCLALDQGDSCGAALKLALVNEGEIPGKHSDELVKEIYKNKAGTWEDDVNRPDMEFLGPQNIQRALQALAHATGTRRVLDLGCGTGLCGQFLRPLAGYLVGVDLSQPMLDLAQEKRLYDELAEQEAVAFMRNHPGVFDLIVGSGVMIFFSDLGPVFNAAHIALIDGGYLVFTLYKSDNADIAIRDNVHFAHSEKYVASCAAHAKLEVIGIESVAHEFDFGRPQPGLLVTLQKPMQSIKQET